MITFVQLKPRMINVLMNALQVENDPQNTHMLLGGLHLCVQDSGTFEEMELGPDVLHTSQQSNDANLLSSGLAQRFSPNFCISFKYETVQHFSLLLENTLNFLFLHFTQTPKTLLLYARLFLVFLISFSLYFFFLFYSNCSSVQPNPNHRNPIGTTPCPQTWRATVSTLLQIHQKSPYTSHICTKLHIPSPSP